MGRLDADLMLAAGFQAQTQFGNESFVTGNAKLFKHLVMRDSFLGAFVRPGSLPDRNNPLTQLIRAQFYPVAPCTARRRGSALDEGDVLTKHGVLTELLNQ